MTQQIRTTLLTGFYELVSQLKGSPEALLISSRINPHQVESLDGYLALDQVAELLNKTASQLNCADFGLRLAYSQGAAALGSLGAAVLQSLTLGEFLNTAIKQLGNAPYNLRVELTKKGKHTHLSFLCIDDLEAQLAEDAPPPQQQSREFLLGVSLVALQHLCGINFQLESVHLKTERPLHDHYENFFGVSVHFGKETDAFILNSSSLLQPTEKCNPSLRPLLKTYIEELLQKGEASLVEQVQQLIYCLMPLKRCSLQEVANQLGMHKRTLQRRLRDRELVFEDLLDRIRRERAEYYLSGKQPPMSQISDMLGYREQSSFNRACYRWFATTPMRVRRQLMAQIVAREAAQELAEVE
ncbi:AraC family transcriptional regulator ligand-binding domain-containing protein [Microbulbifer sp. CnH-101-E]|uniref:AraC family transcriptional regulator ligand-binding domain-containing protein n=1 Tax=unclassified Microbulbifer TaxID=2619833 RepID=UPI0040392C26